MAKSKLEITITAKDQASKNLKKLDKGLEEVNKEAKRSSKGMKAFGKDMLKMGAVVGGVAAGAVIAGKVLFDMGKQGAVVEQTAESFDFLIDKLDLAPDLLEELSGAALGTIDDMTLMSSVSTLLAGTSQELGEQLGEATPELLRIAKAANKLNPSLGSTAQLFRDIATGVKRASPMILDNLGLTISLGKANEEYAEQLGKTVEALTEEEKKIALLNATMRAGDKLIDQVGGDLKSATDDFAKMETSITNLKNAWATLIAEPMADAATFTTIIIDGIIENTEANKLLYKSIDKGIITWDDWREAIKENNNTVMTASELVEWLAEKTEEYQEPLSEVVDGTQKWDKATNELIPSLGEAIDATELLKIEQQELKAALDELQLFIRGPVGTELDNFIEKQGELQQETNDLEAEIRELSDLPYLSKEQQEQLDKLQTELGEVNKAIDENVKAHDEAQKRIVFDLLAQQAAADGLTETEVKGLTYVAEKFGIIDEETARVTQEIAGHLKQLEEDESIYRFGENVQETVDGIGEDTDEVMEYFSEWQEAIAELEGVHPIEFVITATGDIPQRGTKHGPRTGIPKPDDDSYPKGAGKYDEEGVGGQHGLDMIVPPGFANDSFPVWTTSGEHVTVTPKEQELEPAIIIYANIYNDADVEELALKLAETYRTRME